MGEGGGIFFLQVLTRDGLDLLCETQLVPTRGGTESFIACTEEDNGHKGDEERSGGADVPLAEDDAEVLRVPCEEHLHHVSLEIRSRRQ